MNLLREPVQWVHDYFFGFRNAFALLHILILYIAFGFKMLEIRLYNDNNCLHSIICIVLLYCYTELSLSFISSDF